MCFFLHFLTIYWISEKKSIKIFKVNVKKGEMNFWSVRGTFPLQGMSFKNNSARPQLNVEKFNTRLDHVVGILS